jgi:uncharacterized membrane protein YhhN
MTHILEKDGTNMLKKSSFWLAAAFLAIAAVFYYIIIFAPGDILRSAQYGAIVLCFLFAALHLKKGNRWIIAGLLLTLGADFCLVVCQPIQQLWGMVFFLGTQTCYAIALWLRRKNWMLLWVRLGLITVAEAVTVMVLGKNADPLALVSLAYYAMLITNIVVAFTQWKKDKLLPIALVLFLLCDTVIGLQVMSGCYLPIPADSWLHSLIFSGFNLSWFFYLPSQVLLALCARQK